jgi:hypothetical protein
VSSVFSWGGAGIILLPLGNQKRKPTTSTKNFVGKNLPNSPHFEQKNLK